MSESALSPEQVDIAIVGAGPAGSSLALLMAQQGFQTVLIDARDPKAAARPDGRNFAIVRGSWRLLQAAGVADALIDDAQPLRGLEAVDGGTHIFDAPHALFTDKDLDDSEDGPLGFMVEAPRLQAALDAAVAGQSELTVLAPALFDTYRVDGGQARIGLQDGRDLSAGLLVGCDGVQSPVRRAAGIETEGRDYGVSVLAANVRLSRAHDGVARQLFTPEGPFATLPLTGDRANLAWYMKRGAAEALAALPRADIEAELNARFEDFAGRMEIIGDPYAYPLTLQIAERMAGVRAALVGDAARRINPLAGQGLNLGFKDVAALVEVATDARAVGLDVGAPATLERYESWRRFDAAATALALDGVERLFSNDNDLLKPLRGLALTVANRVPPVRRALARQASADQPSLPKLMRGVAIE